MAGFEPTTRDLRCLDLCPEQLYESPRQAEGGCEKSAGRVPIIWAVEQFHTAAAPWPRLSDMKAVGDGHIYLLYARSNDCGNLRSPTS